MKKITGIIPPMVTPFDSNGGLDIGKLRSEANRLLSAGVHGLSIGGSTGEGALLSDDELALCLSAVRDEAGQDVVLLCGILRNSERDAIATALVAKQAGADCLMVTPTFYHGTDAPGNESYYQAIHQASGMPIIIYNVIKNNPVLPEHMEGLLQNPGLIGIKQSVGGLHSLLDMILCVHGRIKVFGAQDDAMYLSYIAGADGAISAILTLFPELCMAQWNAVQSGDIALARAFHDKMLPVWRAIEGGAFPGRIKTALQMRGIDVGDARRPILPTSGADAARIRSAMAASGLLKS